jgi:hypothetical protein
MDDWGGSGHGVCAGLDWTGLDLAARDKKTSESVHLHIGMRVSVRSLDGSSNNMEMIQMHADEET